MNDKVKNHLKLVNITSALAVLILVLFIIELGLVLSLCIECAKIVAIIGIISGFILCGISFSLYSEHPSNNEIMDV